MKINYEDIITKANKRKEALAEFASLAVAAEYHAHAVLTGLLYFENLKEAVERIDAEGKALLGEASGRVQHVGARAKDTRTAFSERGPDHLRLSKLLESLK